MNNRVQGTGYRQETTKTEKTKRTAGEFYRRSFFHSLNPVPCALYPAFQSVKIAEAYVTALEVAASR